MCHPGCHPFVHPPLTTHHHPPKQMCGRANKKKGTSGAAPNTRAKMSEAGEWTTLVTTLKELFGADASALPGLSERFDAHCAALSAHLRVSASLAARPAPTSTALAAARFTHVHRIRHVSCHTLMPFSPRCPSHLTVHSTLAVHHTIFIQQRQATKAADESDHSLRERQAALCSVSPPSRPTLLHHRTLRSVTPLRTHRWLCTPPHPHTHSPQHCRGATGLLLRHSDTPPRSRSHITGTQGEGPPARASDRRTARDPVQHRRGRRGIADPQ